MCDPILSTMLLNPTSVDSSKILKHFQSNVEKGLTSDLAQQNLSKFGKNSIPRSDSKKWYQILVSQFLHPILYILTAATVIAFLYKNYLEAFAILVVILITVAIGFFMELSAVNSLEKLRTLSETKARVIRDGNILSLRTVFLVPGDILLIESGNIVPADARLIEVDHLTVREAILTGESVPIEKNTGALPETTPTADQTNMIFNGTTITSGMGTAIIVSTGANTQLGIIHQIGSSVTQKQTPLEKKLNKLSSHLIWLTLFFCIIIIVLGYLRGQELILMIQIGIALAVASIPEGLPIVATIALAKGMLRLSKKDIIIKNLEAVQTLGATTIICTDKTGTLTEDQMKVHNMVLEGEYIEDLFQKKLDDFDSSGRKTGFETLMRAAVLCNNIAPEENDKHGDSIEFALMQFANHVGIEILDVKNKSPEIEEIPFDPELKMMATLHKNTDSYVVFVKGAFEVIIQHCDNILNHENKTPFNNKQKWCEEIDKLAYKGLRILAFAYKKTKNRPQKEEMLKALTFIGVIGFIDPARKDVPQTIGVYKKAGIKVVMMTGDHPGTAKKIAEDIGLIDSNNSKDKIVLGDDLKDLQNLPKEKLAAITNARIFARVTPEQKLNIINLLQNDNNIVGMLGDGINDIPALKKADIGIAMGIRGADVARDVADVILKDDKFTSIEMAIRQGRVIYQNIKQFIEYLLSSNLAEIISVGLAAILNLPSPLLPLQILYLNLITDIFPALALGLGKGTQNIMEQKPRLANEPILTHQNWVAIVTYGVCLTISVLGVTIYSYYFLKLEYNIINNMAFYTIILAQLLNVFNIPKLKSTFLKNEVTTNKWIWIAIFFCLLITIITYYIPPLANALSMERLRWQELKIVILFGFGSLVLAQLIKRLWPIDSTTSDNHQRG